MLSSRYNYGPDIYLIDDIALNVLLSEPVFYFYLRWVVRAVYRQELTLKETLGDNFFAVGMV